MARDAWVPVHSGSRWEPYTGGMLAAAAGSPVGAQTTTARRSRRLAPLVAVVATILPLGAAGVAIAATQSGQNPTSAVRGGSADRNDRAAPGGSHGGADGTGNRHGAPTGPGSR